MSMTLTVRAVNQSDAQTEDGHVEMDSHGGLEVTIRQTESKKKKKHYPLTS